MHHKIILGVPVPTTALTQFALWLSQHVPADIVFLSDIAAMLSALTKGRSCYKMHVIPLVPETLLRMAESKAIAFSFLPIKFKFYVAFGVNVMEHGFFVVIQPSNSPDNIRQSFRGILLISRISCRHTDIPNASRVLIN
jgi:hypothetical protein